MSPLTVRRGITFTAIKKDVYETASSHREPCYPRICQTWKRNVREENASRTELEIINTTASNHDSFHVTSSWRCLWPTDCRGCTGQGSLGTCPASNNFSKQLLLAAVGDRLGGCWTSGQTQDICLMTFAFAILRKAASFAHPQWTFERLLQNLSCECCEGLLQGSLPFSVQNSPDVFNRPTKVFWNNTSFIWCYQ